MSRHWSVPCRLLRVTVVSSEPLALVHIKPDNRPISHWTIKPIKLINDHSARAITGKANNMTTNSTNDLARWESTGGQINLAVRNNEATMDLHTATATYASAKHTMATNAFSVVA